MGKTFSRASEDPPRSFVIAAGAASFSKHQSPRDPSYFWDEPGDCPCAPCKIAYDEQEDRASEFFLSLNAQKENHEHTDRHEDKGS